jgi:hypothetical protein
MLGSKTVTLDPRYVAVDGRVVAAEAEVTVSVPAVASARPDMRMRRRCEGRRVDMRGNPSRNSVAMNWLTESYRRARMSSREALYGTAIASASGQLA